MNNERKRLFFQQYQMMKAENPDMFVSFPDNANPALWHVTFRGPKDSPFEKGLYHLQIDLKNYPTYASEIIALHKNGGYAVNAELCIQGLTSQNPTTWSPSTTVSAMATALRSYMVGDDRSGMNILPLPSNDEIRRIAQETLTFVCPKCGVKHAELNEKLPPAV